MRETTELQRRAPSDPQQYWFANHRFHRLMWRASGNRELELAMQSIYRKLEAVVSVVDDEPLSVRADLHDATLDAIVRGDHQLIEEVMDAHFAHLERLCEEKYGRARVRSIPPFLLGAGGERSLAGRKTGPRSDLQD